MQCLMSSKNIAKLPLKLFTHFVGFFVHFRADTHGGEFVVFCVGIDAVGQEDIN